jgi:hypothetical protein
LPDFLLVTVNAIVLVVGVDVGVVLLVEKDADSGFGRPVRTFGIR